MVDFVGYGYTISAVRKIRGKRKWRFHYQSSGVESVLESRSEKRLRQAHEDLKAGRPWWLNGLVR